MECGSIPHMLYQRKLARMVIGAVLKTVVNRKVVWVRVLQLPLRGVSGSSPLLDVMSSWCSGNTTRIHCKVAQWESRALLMLWLQVRVLPLQFNGRMTERSMYRFAKPKSTERLRWFKSIFFRYTPRSGEVITLISGSRAGFDSPKR